MQHQQLTNFFRSLSEILVGHALCPGQRGSAPLEKRVSRRLRRHIMNVIVRPASSFEAMLSLLGSRTGECDRKTLSRDVVSAHQTPVNLCHAVNTLTNAKLGKVVRFPGKKRDRSTKQIAPSCC